MAAKTPSMQAPVELALGLVHRIRLFLGQARPLKQQLPLAGGPPSPGVVKHVFPCVELHQAYGTMCGINIQTYGILETFCKLSSLTYNRKG